MNFLFTCTANLDVACTSGQSGHPCANATSLLAAASTLKDSRRGVRHQGHRRVAVHERGMTLIQHEIRPVL